MNIQVSKGKCGVLIMKETGEMAAHMRFHNLWIQIKYPLADQLMNFFSQQSKNTNDFFYCDSWSKELFGECFMKFRNFSCSAKLLPGFLKVAVDISCFIKGCDSWMDWLYVNTVNLTAVFYLNLSHFSSVNWIKSIIESAIYQFVQSFWVLSSVWKRNLNQASYSKETITLFRCD